MVVFQSYEDELPTSPWSIIEDINSTLLHFQDLFLNFD